MIRRSLCSVVLALSFCVAAPAFAQWAVIDPVNLIQNINQVRQAVDQIKQLQAQLKNAERQLEGMSGNRGMRQLETDVTRDYIPRDWRETLAMGSGGGGINGMISELRGTLGDIGSAGLSNTPAHVLKAMEDSAQYDLEAWGRATSVYNRANERFDELERLGDAINSANDQKAILDLMARLQLETNMLLNEMVRMQAEMAATDRQRTLMQQQQMQNKHSKAMDSF